MLPGPLQGEGPKKFGEYLKKGVSIFYLYLGKIEFGPQMIRPGALKFERIRVIWPKNRSSGNTAPIRCVQ